MVCLFTDDSHNNDHDNDKKKKKDSLYGKLLQIPTQVNFFYLIIFNVFKTFQVQACVTRSK